ncbi:Uncharacterized protein TCM_031739 [Theobroma cacao]|uniref:Uncharacterized protein n=1 Tax=Theobroma cacao TaxID=3641 RepID=A0A061F871_THECC|nr:Uncharacterized protein TCM_031739 [Theobroma cacao]
MESSISNQDAPTPSKIQDLMRMIQASQEKMQTLEDNNRRMIETISQLTSFIATTAQAQLVHLNESLPDGVTLLVTNTDGNEGNKENAANAVLAASSNPSNSTSIVTLATLLLQ